MSVMFVYVQNCVRVARATTVFMLRVQNYKCVSCAGTGAANAYTKRDIENPFSGTQMFVQARNKKCPQQYVS